jgi:hypothetical protein
MKLLIAHSLVLTLLWGVLQQFGNFSHQLSHLQRTVNVSSCNARNENQKCGKCCSERKKKESPCERSCKDKQQQFISYLLFDAPAINDLNALGEEQLNTITGTFHMRKGVLFGCWKPPQA